MGRPKRMTLEKLEGLSGEDLKAEWARWHDTPIPMLSADLIRRGIAYRMQERECGGLDRATQAFLRRKSDDEKGGFGQPRRKLSPGTRLVRDWHGVGHTVTVLDNGFEYDDREWSSLTAIALAITGAKWNGPRFFGLSEVKR